jgi:hypothetical protein
MHCEEYLSGGILFLASITREESVPGSLTVERGHVIDEKCIPVSKN